MKQVIILAVIGLVVGLGGGTGIAVLTAPAATPDSTAATPDHVAVDSTTEIAAAHEVSSDSTPADSSHRDATPPDTGHRDSSTVKPAGSLPVTVHDSTPRAPAPVRNIAAEDAAADSAASVQLRRISRTFASMAPRDAAKVLELMEDADITAIIGSLTDKQGAAILAAFPPARAAAISRARLAATRVRTP